MNEIAVRKNNEIHISDQTEKLIKAGIAENTIRAYRRALVALDDWMQHHENSLRLAPNGNAETALCDSVLASYITHLYESGKAPSTIAQIIAAVKWRSRTLGLEDVVGPITTRTLAGIRREGKERGRGQVDGLTWEDVQRVCAYAESSETLAGLRDSAMINLMSDCLLRVSEVVAVDAGDVNGNVLNLRHSKTDQEGEGVSLYICEPTREIIKHYSEEAGISEGALFRRVRFHQHIGKGRLSLTGARTAIKRWAAEAGVKGFISGHSLRVGSAVSLARAGATVVDMQTAGRWKSANMPAHYASAELAERGAIARFKDGK